MKNRLFQAPIISTLVGNHKVYFYSDLNHTIGKQTYDESTIHRLNEACEILKQISGIPTLDKIIHSISKVQKENYPNYKFLSFDDNLDLKGRDLVDTLFNHIMKKNVLEIKYKDFDHPNPMLFNFHPYFLKQFKNRWYVYGLN